MASRRGLTGEVVKTVSGSDLFPRVASLYNLPVYETPIGYKYIADRMLLTKVLVGGEESGGIGYGNHIPERDGLLSALYLLEAIRPVRTRLKRTLPTLAGKNKFYLSLRSH
jgi:phosphomannomutase